MSPVQKAETLYLQARQRLMNGEKSLDVQQQLQRALQISQELQDTQLSGLILNDLQRHFNIGTQAQELLSLYRQAVGNKVPTFNSRFAKLEWESRYGLAAG